MMRAARKELGIDAAHTTMIGDTMETDILGHDENHLIDGVTFENVKIGGKWIRSAEDMNLVSNAFVQNLKFIAPPPDV